MGASWPDGGPPTSAAAYLVPPFAYAALLVVLQVHDQYQLRPLLKLRRVHNLCLAAYSAWVFVVMLQKLLLHDRFASVHDLACRASPGYPSFWYESKVWEWYDTCLIVGAGSVPMQLHLQHHASTASLVALNVVGREMPTPLFDFATCCNGLVHVFTYLYFSAPRYFRPVRRWITQLQIAQHVLVCASLVYALTTPGCDTPLRASCLSLAVYLVYLGQFAHFYRTAYLQRVPKRCHGS